MKYCLTNGQCLPSNLLIYNIHPYWCSRLGVLQGYRQSLGLGSVWLAFQTEAVRTQNATLHSDTVWNENSGLSKHVPL